MRKALAVLLTTLFLSSAASAAPVLSFDELTGANALNQDQTVGWQFDVLSSLTVTGLGWFDEGGDGLAESHQVGLWDPSGTLIASVEVPAGTVADLDGQFRTVAVVPFVLAPGNGYIIGGLNSSTNSERLAANVTVTTNPAIRFVGPRFGGLGTRPTNPSVASTGFFGPSFSIQVAQVPEPTLILLTGVGLAWAGARRLRRHRS